MFPKWFLPLFSLIFLQAASSITYEVRGWIDRISSDDIDPQHSDDVVFRQKFEMVKQRISEIIGDDFNDFQIFDYKIHGEDTAVFYAYLLIDPNSKLKRQDIIDRFETAPDAQLFVLTNKGSNFVISKSRFVAGKSDDVTSCQNGGILLPNATCACPLYVSGAQCEILSCQNNGVAYNGKCACPPGLYSAHCEARTCIGNVKSAVDFSSQSLILVINTRLSMAYDINTIASNIQSILDSYSSQQVTLSNFVLTIFRYTNTGFLSKPVYFMDTEVFTTSDDLLNFLQHSVTVSASSNDQPILDAIAAAQSTSGAMRSKSLIFVFADSRNYAATKPSTIFSGTNESIVIQQTLSWRNKIILVLSQFSNSPISTSGNYFDVLRRVITATHGDLLIVDKLELPEILTNTFSHFINGQNTFVQYYNNKAKTIPITSDSSTIPTNILITVENGATVPGVNDKNGNRLTPTSAGKRFALYRVTQSVSDSIQIVAGDSGVPTHSTRVWFTSTFDVLISYSNDDSIDNGYAHTFNGIQHRPTIYSSFPMTSSLIVSQWDSFNSTVIQGASESSKRNSTSSQCIFPFQLDRIDSCTAGPFVHHIQITTSNQTDLYRAVPGYCFTPLAHLAPIFTCLNNGTRSGPDSCRCTADFSGKHCETPNCRNGGRVDNFPNGNGHGLCVCPEGVTGVFCEIISCSSSSNVTFQSYRRSIGIVVQSSLSSAAGMQQLNQGLSKLLQKGKSNDFQEFVLTTYKNRKIGNETHPDVATTRFTNAFDFLSATTSDNILYTSSPSGPQPGLFALDSTVRAVSNDKSSIIFFTDSTAINNQRDKNLTDVLQLIISRDIDLTIILIPPYNSLEFCSTADNYEIYAKVASETGGVFINLCQNVTTSGDPVNLYLSTFAQIHQRTEIVGHWTASDCSNFTTDPFYISDVKNDVFIIVNSPTIPKFDVSVNDIRSSRQTLQGISLSIPFFVSYQVLIRSSSTTSTSFTANIESSLPGEVCYVRIVERSQFASYIGFSKNPSVDRGSTSLTYGTRQFGVVHLSSALQTTPTVQVDLIDNSNSKTTRMLEKRVNGCRYEFSASEEFACHIAGSSFTVQTIITTSQTIIQRTQRAYCQELSACQNGGIENNGTCHCADGYGSLHCEVPLCQNGGSIIDFKCECPTGFDGDLCEYQKCNDWNFIETHDPREKFPQQIIFVVEVKSLPVAIANMLLINNIDSFISSTDDITNPRQYSLITFDDQNVNVVVSSSNRQTFVSAFKNAMIFDSKTLASVLSLDALSQAYKIVDQLPAVIYLLTGTAPRTLANSEVTHPQYGVQINTIWFGSDYDQLILANLNSSFVTASRQSNGRILMINPLRTDELLNVFASGLSENQLILDDGAQSCSGSGVTFRFPVESGAVKLIFSILGRSVQLLVKDENDNLIDFSNSTILSDVNSVVQFVDIRNHSAGVWTATLSGSAACFIQVRAHTALQIIPKFTENIGDDYGSPVPRVGAGALNSSFITFRAIESFSIDQQNSGATVEFVEGWNTDYQQPWRINSLATNSTISLRDPLECASQFVTQQQIEWKSAYEKFVVTGRDASGNVYQRTFFFSATASSTDCLNGATVDDHGFCVCDRNHYGPKCQHRQCQNGGTSEYGLCDCSNGYFGDYCEKYFTQSS